MNSRKLVTMAIALGAILTLCLYTLAVAEEEDDIIFIDDFMVPQLPHGVLNDTGMFWCGDGFNHDLECPVDLLPNQDGDLGRDALARAGLLDKVGDGAAGFDFTKLDDSGNELPANAEEWACVRDNHTGLTWEVKTQDGGLQDRDNTYSWYNPNPATNGGDPGTDDEDDCVTACECTGSPCNTHAYAQAVNDQELCGIDDWRLPTRMELRMMVHHGVSDPMVDINYFPNTPSSRFWTASPHAAQESRAWHIHFEDGTDKERPKSFGESVRLVHSEH